MEAGKEREKNKVMVAIAESEYGHYALTRALDFLKDTVVNSKLIIFTVQNNSNFGYVYASSFGAAPANLIESIQENQKNVASALLQRAKETCAHHGMVAETMTEIGDPKEAICEAVEKLNISLLIVGSHSRGAISRALLGSVSNYCVQHAKCPVLVVKKPI